MQPNQAWLSKDKQTVPPILDLIKESSYAKSKISALLPQLNAIKKLKANNDDDIFGEEGKLNK